MIDVADLAGGPIFAALRKEFLLLEKNKKKYPPNVSADRLEKMIHKTQKK